MFGDAANSPRGPELTSDLCVWFLRPVGCWPVSTPSGPFQSAVACFAIRDLPGVVIRSLPCRFTMYPSSINRARCWAGMTAGGSRIAHVLPTVRREANSSGVRGSDAMIRLCPLTCIGTWSNLLISGNTASEQSGAPARDDGHSRQRPPK
jgi:hypothetical protein